MNKRFAYCVLAIFLHLACKPQEGKYDINDPRNPDCPCHKYQKIADREYENLLAMNNKVSKNSGEQTRLPEQELKETINKNLSGTEKETKKKNIYFLKNKRKRKNKAHSKWRKILECQHWDFWKRNLITDACSKW